MTRIGDSVEDFDLGRNRWGAQAHIVAYMRVRLSPLPESAIDRDPRDNLQERTRTSTFAGLELCMQQQEEDDWYPHGWPEQRVESVHELLKLLEEPSFAGRWV
eukprot:SAG31_NODE_1585_length_7821_cov_5.615903_8_plen_103_part_00